MKGLLDEGKRGNAEKVRSCAHVTGHKQTLYCDLCSQYSLSLLDLPAFK